MPGGELVIGIVGAVGTNLLQVCDDLKTALDDVAYKAHPIRLSHLLHDLAPYKHLPQINDQEKAINDYMNAGNELCQQTRADIMALLAIAAIRSYRRDEQPEIPPEQAEDEPLTRTAYILNSLKRPDEVKLLQEVYGRGFLLVSAFSTRSVRREALAKRIGDSQSRPPEQCYPAAEHLISRDEFETDVQRGQNVRDTFPLADIFVDAGGAVMLFSVIRAISIAFGHPFQTPTRAELGMQVARSAALRSADVSRQVGYAACSADGQVISSGANEVAKAGGGFYWPDSVPDNRDFQFSVREPNAAMKEEILQDLMARLERQGLLRQDFELSTSTIDKVTKSLRGTMLMDITEYGRAVHAEMAVLTDAARRGVSLAGSTMYGTTFPCHNCAKHIVAAGVEEVVYIEPYPKSQVARLYGDSISIEEAAKGKIRFAPFVGIAPQRYSEFFEMPDRKGDGARIKKWEEIKSTAVPRIFSDPASYIPLEYTKVQALGMALAGANIEFVSTSGEEGSVR